MSAREGHYRQPPVIDEEGAARGLASSDPNERAETIIRAALSALPRARVEAWLRDALDDADPRVRSAAATAAGHTARLEHALASDLVKRLEALKEDRATAGAATDALDDVATFTQR